jgi:hypothetical protein
MKNTRLALIVVAAASACVQGPQQAPPPPAPAATAAQPAVPVVAPPVAMVVESPAPEPVTKAKAEPAPVVKETKAPASRPAPVPARAAAPAPNAVPAATAAPEPKRVRMDIPKGTELPLEFQTSVGSATSKVGDPVIAVLTKDIPLDGFTLDRGSEVRGEVVTVVAAARVKGRARIVVAFDSVMKAGERLSVVTEAIDTTAASTGGKDKKIVAGGAVGGLILGALKDGKKGAAIGTVVGAAAGVGAVMVMKGDEVEIPRGAHLTVAVVK